MAKGKRGNMHFVQTGSCMHVTYMSTCMLHAIHMLMTCMLFEPLNYMHVTYM